jgi:hypothetical protein
MKLLSHHIAFLVFTLAFMLLQVASAATLSSTVNRNQLSTNETLTLTVSIDQQVDSSELDIRPLQENFEILGATPQTRSSLNIINGKRQHAASTTWTIILVPKSEGILTIPAFTLKSTSSKPISIRVSNSAANDSSALPLDVSVTSDAKEVYPNQQLVITIEISAGNNVRDLSGAQLTILGADVEVFDQQNFQRVDNGIARQIVILKYSVFAKQAGDLTVPIMTYTALQNGQRSVFGDRGAQVIARSKAIKVKVKEAPKSGKRQWFPAEDVSITSSWSGDGSTLKVGEPITRTVTITAKGQMASAIPPLEQVGKDPGLKSYKDQPQLDTKTSNQGFVATRIESEALVANQAGEYLLPAVSIDWWNTKTKQWQTSTVEPHTLSVTGVALPTNRPTEALALESQTATANVITDTNSTRLWQIISTLLGLIVALQSYLLIKPRKPKQAPNSNQQQAVTERAAWSSLKGALTADNSRAIRSNLLLWGREALASEVPISLDELARAGKTVEVSDELKESFVALDAHLYQAGDKPDIAKMTHMLDSLRSALLKSSAGNQKTKAELKPLYPS